MLRCLIVVLLCLPSGASDAGQMARTGRAARVASRTARLIRIVRVLRVLRVFKVFRFFGGFVSVKEEEQTADERRKSSTTKMGARLAERISQRVILVVLTLFVGVVIVLQGYEMVDEGPEVGLDWMESMRENSTVKGSVNADGSTNTEGVPLLISHLAANIYVGTLPQTILCLKDLGQDGRLFRFPRVDNAGNDCATAGSRCVSIVEDRRDSEVQIFWGSNGNSIAAIDYRDYVIAEAWSNIVIVLVLLFVMVGSSYIFKQDTEELVVRKISVIVDSVNKMSGTLKFLGGDEDKEDQNEEAEGMETEMIETAMEKMSELLRIGFGEAGNSIIAKNLMGTGELNAMLPGQHVTAVFGFCDIRKFSEITDVLRGQVMPFVNQIAKIVHNEVVMNGGAPNKNIGDAFLCSWKTEDFTETPRSQQGIEEDAAAAARKQNRMRRLSLSHMSSSDLQAGIKDSDEGQEMPLEYTTKADQALKSFTDIIQILRSRKTELMLRKRHARIYMHKPNFKVDMGFGLHHGWAIEGAIGSIHKIDVSYLSPHVNMSARLEAATKQFGVPMLMSGERSDPSISRHLIY